MTRRERERFRSGVISQTMFDNAILAGLADPGGCLSAGAESPLRMPAGTGIGWLRSPQRMRVFGLRLRLELQSVTVAASGASDVA